MDLNITKHVFDNQTRFSDLVDYKNFCYIVNKKRLAIKYKKNINLPIEDKVLRLLDIFYIISLILNLISIIRLWKNVIGIYFSFD